MDSLHSSEKYFHLLSELVLSSPESRASFAHISSTVRNMSLEEFDGLVRLAAKNHVILRAFDQP